MPPITAAASTTRVTSSERLIEQVNDALSLELYNSPPNRKGCLFLTSLLARFPVFFVARDELLNPENDTIGILVSTALEMTIGGKTIKPAGG